MEKTNDPNNAVPNGAVPNRAVSNRAILEAIDACRPGSEDLLTPPLADIGRQVRDDVQLWARYCRLQQFDAAVAESLCDGAVPEGLADRLLARLAEEPQPTAVEPAETIEVSTETARLPRASGSEGSGSKGPAPREFTRRRWLLVGGGLGFSAAAAALFCIVYLGRSPLGLNLEQALEEVRAFYMLPVEGHGTLLAEQPPPAEFAMSSAVIATSQTRWRPISGELLGRKGVAYELFGAAGVRATLYVVDLRGPAAAPRLIGLPVAPSRNPQTTGGLAMAGWQEASRLVVLVVEGDQRQFHRFLRPAAPIA